MAQVAIPFKNREEMIWFKSVLDDHPDVFDSRKTAKKNGKHVVTVFLEDISVAHSRGLSMNCVTLAQ